MNVLFFHPATEACRLIDMSDTRAVLQSATLFDAGYNAFEVASVQGVNGFRPNLNRLKKKAGTAVVYKQVAIGVEFEPDAP